MVLTSNARPHVPTTWAVAHTLQNAAKAKASLVLRASVMMQLNCWVNRLENRKNQNLVINLWTCCWPLLRKEMAPSLQHDDTFQSYPKIVFKIVMQTTDVRGKKIPKKISMLL